MIILFYLWISRNYFSAGDRACNFFPAFANRVGQSVFFRQKSSFGHCQRLPEENIDSDTKFTVNCNCSLYSKAYCMHETHFIRNTCCGGD